MSGRGGGIAALVLGVAAAACSPSTSGAAVTPAAVEPTPPRLSTEASITEGTVTMTVRSTPEVVAGETEQSTVSQTTFRGCGRASFGPVSQPLGAHPQKMARQTANASRQSELRTELNSDRADWDGGTESQAVMGRGCRREQAEELRSY